LPGWGKFRSGIFKGTSFLIERLRIIHGGADLNQVLGAVGIAGEKIDLVTFAGFNVSDLSMSAEELDHYGCLKSMTNVRFPAAVTDLGADSGRNFAS
jgi:hypothetical protein